MHLLLQVKMYDACCMPYFLDFVEILCLTAAGVCNLF